MILHFLFILILLPKSSGVGVTKGLGTLGSLVLDMLLPFFCFIFGFLLVLASSWSVLVWLYGYMKT